MADSVQTNDCCGACRGSGVLGRAGDAWLVEQHNLTIPVPDAIAADVVTRIRETP